MPIKRCRKDRRSQGYTMMEMVVAIACMSLIGISFMSLYITMLRSGASIISICNTSTDAANAIGRVTAALREARRFELMDGGSYGNTYLATDSTGDIIVTGLRIYYPAVKSNVSITTTAGGGGIVALSGGQSIVDNRTDGNTLDVYRSDASGNPAPNDGVCLWIKGTLNDSTLPAGGRALIKDIATTPNAVQFIQPYVPGSSTPMVNQVVMKVTTGTYDRAQGTITSEATRGNIVTRLTGEHVYLRNHDPLGATSGGVHGQTQY